ncbi:MAG: hypothetical protein ACR2M9_01880 [Cyanophyceae cyanobacterium]
MSKSVKSSVNPDSDEDEIERLREETERLRELLEGVVDDMVTLGEDWEYLLAKIKKEVNDE